MTVNDQTVRLDETDDRFFACCFNMLDPKGWSEEKYHVAKEYNTLIILIFINESHKGHI